MNLPFPKLAIGAKEKLVSTGMVQLKNNFETERLIILTGISQHENP